MHSPHIDSCTIQFAICTTYYCIIATPRTGSAEVKVSHDLLVVYKSSMPGYYYSSLIQVLLMFSENRRHMFWDCPEHFWSQVANIVTDLLEIFIPESVAK